MKSSWAHATPMYYSLGSYVLASGSCCVCAPCMDGVPLFTIVRQDTDLLVQIWITWFKSITTETIRGLCSSAHLAPLSSLPHAPVNMFEGPGSLSGLLRMFLSMIPKPDHFAHSAHDDDHISCAIVAVPSGPSQRSQPTKLAIHATFVQL